MRRGHWVVVGVVFVTVVMAAFFLVARSSKLRNDDSQDGDGLKHSAVAANDIAQPVAQSANEEPKTDAAAARVPSAPPVPQPPMLRNTPDRKVAENLVSKRDEASRTKMLEIYRRTDNATRRRIERHAVESDPKLKSTIVEQAVMTLDSTDPSQKATALETLRFMADPSGVEKADLLLSDNQKPEVVIAAIGYLGRVNNEASFDKVIALAKDAPDTAVKATAIRNLVLVGGKEHPEETVSALNGALFSQDTGQQLEALRLLGRFTDKITPEMEKRIAELACMRTGNDREKEQVHLAAKMLSDQLKALKEVRRAEYQASR